MKMYLHHESPRVMIEWRLDSTNVAALHTPRRAANLIPIVFTLALRHSTKHSLQL